MYPQFADITEKEDFLKIALILRVIAVAEKHQEERYKKLLRVIENNSVFEKEQKVYWVCRICRKCEYVYEGKEPPEKCPSCSHSKNYLS